jgi:hypothetical protein
MTHVRLSPWSQPMVVAECLAVATLSIGIREIDISAEDFQSAFVEAWSHWEPASPTGGYRQPADFADLIASYTEVALPARGELARDGYGDTAWWFRRPRRTWRAAVTGHGQRGIRSPQDLLWLA